MRDWSRESNHVRYKEDPVPKAGREQDGRALGDMKIRPRADKRGGGGAQARLKQDAELVLLDIQYRAPEEHRGALTVFWGEVTNHLMETEALLLRRTSKGHIGAHPKILRALELNGRTLTVAGQTGLLSDRNHYC